MKNFLKSVLFVLAFFFLCNASHAQETINISTGEYIPFASESLNHKGFSSHVIKEAFAKEGYSVKFRFLPWKRALEDTKKLKYDASSFWFITEDKQKVFHYSDSLNTEKTVFFHLKTTKIPDWKTMQDLSKFRIGATRGYSYSKEFWQAGKNGIINIEEASSDETNFKKLLKERIDIFPSGIVVGYGTLNKLFDRTRVDMLTYNPQVLRESTSHLIFPKNSPKSLKYLEAFNKGLDKLKTEGLYQKFYDDLLAGRYILTK